MNTYLILFSFTQKGIESVTSLASRIDGAKQTITRYGGKLESFHGILGSHYDTMTIVKAADDEKIATIAMAISRLGNVRSETHRLFSEDELVNLTRSIG
jgi:uncharacterized protein with GYD domain